MSISVLACKSGYTIIIVSVPGQFFFRDKEAGRTRLLHTMQYGNISAVFIVWDRDINLDNNLVNEMDFHIKHAFYTGVLTRYPIVSN